MKCRRPISQGRALLRRALPAGTFVEREEAALAVSNEVVRSLLEEELQEIADGFEDQVVGGGRGVQQARTGSADLPLAVRRTRRDALQLPAGRRAQRAYGRAAGAGSRVDRAGNTSSHAPTWWTPNVRRRTRSPRWRRSERRDENSPRSSRPMSSSWCSMTGAVCLTCAASRSWAPAEQLVAYLCLPIIGHPRGGLKLRTT